MKRLLLFERQLAVECDTACHTVAEAQGEPDAGDGAASAETLRWAQLRYETSSTSELRQRHVRRRGLERAQEWVRRSIRKVF